MPSNHTQPSCVSSINSITSYHTEESKREKTLKRNSTKEEQKCSCKLLTYTIGSTVARLTAIFFSFSMALGILRSWWKNISEHQSTQCSGVVSIKKCELRYKLETVVVVLASNWECFSDLQFSPSFPLL